MIPLPFFIFLLGAPTALAVCTQLQNCPQFSHLNTTRCQTYHNFLARGSDSPYPGHLIETLGKVCNALNSKSHPNVCGYEDIQYPALNGNQWCPSAHQGVINAVTQMSNYAARCPNSSLVLMGYSQGASVFLDVLGGGGGHIWNCTQEANPGMNISTVPGSKIAAALVFGAARRSANQSWTEGGGQLYNGTSPRTETELEGLQPYADAGLLREYCQPGDPICAAGSPNQNISKHLDYFDIWGTEAAAWVVDLARKAAPVPTSGAWNIHITATQLHLLYVILGLLTLFNLR